VDVEAIAIDHLDLDVQEHPDLRRLADAPRLPRNAALSGILLPAKRRIWVNAAETARSPARRAFTIAHELGHWELHRDLGVEAHARFCRTEEVGANGVTRIEREANQFAAALLMPADLVRAAVAERGTDVVALARAFGVSSQAMHIRLETLRLLPEYLL
jgi:Zn-dependent peptidase ImmA (M78 family)